MNEPDGEVQKLCAAAAAVTDAVVDVSFHHQRAHAGRHVDLLYAHICRFSNTHTNTIGFSSSFNKLGLAFQFTIRIVIQLEQSVMRCSASCGV